ncbi:hypothetical protein [Pseudomonas aeruginosa]|uniref:hypothetical protein n=1 Tax=Pseudomonas aeruginosa TaxID=287 RepID=UPI00287F4142|nr:hypothetical protein [Pseudomonas aeruginosa]
MPLDFVDLAAGAGTPGSLHEQVADAMAETMVGMLNTREDILSALRRQYPDEADLQRFLTDANNQVAREIHRAVGGKIH